MFATANQVPRLFGGSLLKGNAKVRRPLSTKEAIHLVLKSEKAIGSRSMLSRRNVNHVDKLIRRQAKLGGIRIFRFVNVGNHLHLVIRIQNRKCFAKFIRSVTGLIARHVMENERGKERGDEYSNSMSRALRKTKFWISRPFTRLISWGKDFNHLSRYMAKNRAQAKSQRQRVFTAWGFDITEPNQIRFLNTG